MKLAVLTALALGIAAAPALAQQSLSPVQPQAGQCKTQAVQAPAQPKDEFGRPIPWMQKVASLYGNNWSVWPAAQEQKIISLPGNQRIQIASGRPCYVPPVR